jgi:hypothetical protein
LVSGASAAAHQDQSFARRSIGATGRGQDILLQTVALRQKIDRDITHQLSTEWGFSG